ncbi:nucleotidyltransferase family protein [Shewanella sp. D64]|uniref:nucleotidyltransferase family protein n=1 Tax=unclassified Shewanella TaxID=196818 RepID=UPI0022BA1D2E|nr:MULTISPECIES: nucleotidyltransferase family protein [unclassified Shewanella]MEC4726924.1 nucleotidyltransferase family protein [Shewanella sp. D64]MEC4738579.1 nucleotidyltransferase family protein [Shewanella sp. E94]WBJ93797.1 nucleotidyltransferase family protein [Shewanella sp. MTB7]
MNQDESDSKSLISHEVQLTAWIRQDPLRMRALQLVQVLHLPQGFIAAGFVRNLVWDRLHGVECNRLLADIDVIYFNPSDISAAADKAYELELRELAPELPWSVKNQARMHIRNDDAPYLSSLDAMSYWPEQETAVGVMLHTGAIAEKGKCDDGIKLVSAFGFESLFNLKLTPNNKRSLALFEARLADKKWAVYYPKLIIN